MPTLYITEPGARLEKEYRRLLVTKDDEVLLSVPLRQVTEVVLIGRAGVTTPALWALLRAGAGLTIASRSGRLLGRLRPAEARNLVLRRRQYACSGDEVFSLSVSRAFITGKLANSRVLAMRILRSRNLPAEDALSRQLNDRLARLNEALEAATAAGDLPALRGFEGRGARAYFGILRAAFRWRGPPFEKRTRRPPRDPINSLLSLGYTLLTDALFTAAEVAGLDPYAGFFHADKYGRPALALDLVEEFRALIVDSVVLTVINKRILQEKDFTEGDDDGIYLTRRGLRLFLQQFVRRLNTKVYHPVAGRQLSYQKCFEIQARQLRKVIEGQVERYQPFRTR